MARCASACGIRAPATHSPPRRTLGRRRRCSVTTKRCSALPVRRRDRVVDRRVYEPIDRSDVGRAPCAPCQACETHDPAALKQAGAQRSAGCRGAFRRHEGRVDSARARSTTPSSATHQQRPAAEGHGRTVGAGGRAPAHRGWQSGRAVAEAGAKRVGGFRFDRVGIEQHTPAAACAAAKAVSRTVPHPTSTTTLPCRSVIAAMAAASRSSRSRQCMGLSTRRRCLRRACHSQASGHESSGRHAEGMEILTP